jgi:transcription initiation factor TFIID subunit 2
MKNSSTKTVTFVVPQLVSSHQIAFAVGPFSKMNLSDLREYEEDDLNNIRAAVDIFGYCLPGRDPELRNSSLFMSKVPLWRMILMQAMDHFVREYGSFPYSTFKLCFVDDAPQQVQASASITICSNNVLYPADIIDSLFPTTKLLTVALTSQWIGVNIVPKKWSDMWLTIGLSYYMAGIFLKKLMGNNEYRFRMKKDMERICIEDIGQRPLADAKMDAPLPDSTMEFMALKAPVVLFILNQRLTKPANSVGLQKVITKILLDGMSGDLVSLSTTTFLRKCEKHGHMRLDAFANQYIFGTGVPRFQISQRFNRKKTAIEVVLKQMNMSQRPPRKLTSELFIQDGLKHLDKETPPPVQQLFTVTNFKYKLIVGTNDSPCIRRRRNTI